MACEHLVDQCLFLSLLVSNKWSQRKASTLPKGQDIRHPCPVQSMAAKATATLRFRHRRFETCERFQNGLDVVAKCRVGSGTSCKE